MCMKISKTVLTALLVAVSCAVSARAASGYGESPSFMITSSQITQAPLPPVGVLTVTAGTTTQLTSTSWQATGNVTVNNVIRVDGTVTVNTSTQRVCGNGQIWIDMPQPLGTVLVYNGPWEFDASRGISTALNKALSGLKLVGLDLEVEKLAIEADGIRIQGSIRMPSILGGAELAITGDDYVELSATNGLQFSGASFTIPSVQGLSLGGLGFSEEGVSLQVSSDEIEVRGTLEFPQYMGGATIDLSSDANHVSITLADGQPHVEVVGSAGVPGPVMIGPGFSLQDMTFAWDSTSSSFQIDGILNTPAGFGIVAGIGFAGGALDYVHGGFASKNWPILWTPVGVPILFWQDADVGLDNLAPGGPPLVLDGHILFTGGPQMMGGYLLGLDGTGEYNTAGRFTGTMGVTLGGGAHPLRMASALVICDKTYGVYIGGNASLANMLTSEGVFRLDLQNAIHGELAGTIYLPQWMWNGAVVSRSTLYAQAYDDTDYTNDYVIGALQGVFGFETAVKVDLNTGHVDWFADMDLINEIDVPPLMSGMRPPSAAPSVLSLPAGLDGAIFEVTWEQGDTDLQLTTPNGTVITAENWSTFPEVKYFKDTQGLKALYAVTAPEGGDWQADVTDATGIGGYTIKVYKKTVRPVISVLEPASDQTGAPVTITWTDAPGDGNSAISLYFDTDRNGADGVAIAAGIPASDSANQYSWDTTGVPAGTYYVYAKIDDGVHVPDIRYSVGRVTVTDPVAPLPPTGLAAAPTGQPGKMQLRWTPGGGTVDHYLVSYTSDPAGEDYETTVTAGGQPGIVVDNLVPGAQYRFAVAAVDADGHSSLPCTASLVTVLKTGNNNPVFTGKVASQATADQPYTSQVPAIDRDGDTISYSLVTTDPNVPVPPAGMAISSTGVITWTPTSPQAGENTFAVALSDGQGAPPRNRSRSAFRPQVRQAVPRRSYLRLRLRSHLVQPIRIRSRLPTLMPGTP